MSSEHSAKADESLNTTESASPLAPADEMLHKELTYRIIGAAMKVHRALGPGFTEAIYHEAMKVELAALELPAESETAYKVHYAGKAIGRFRADLVVEAKVLVELKAVETLTPLFRQQVVSYLKASHLRVGLLINFGTKSLIHERFVN